MTEITKHNPLETFDNEDLDIPTDIPDMGNTPYLLVYPVTVEAKTKGGLILDEAHLDHVEKLMSFGKVVAKGKLCYLTKAAHNPVTNEYMHWCEIGDWVVWNRLSEATPVIFASKKFWVIPDINILYTVKDPRRIDPRYSVIGYQGEDE